MNFLVKIILPIIIINLNCQNTNDINDNDEDIFFISFYINGVNNKFFKGYSDSLLNVPAKNAYYVFHPDSNVYDSLGTGIISRYIESYLLVSCEKEVVNTSFLTSTRSFELMIFKSGSGGHLLVMGYQNYDSLYSSVPRQFMNEIDTSIILNDTIIGHINDTFNLYPATSLIDVDSTKTPLVFSNISFTLKRIK